MVAVRDRLSRPLRDLRVSVTDRCNFRCRYCMPLEVFGPGHAFLPKSEILTFEEICEVVAAAVPLGLRKVRLTGGEPLLRRDVVALVAGLAAVGGVEDLAMTTNGALLSRFAAQLAAAGLGRISVSLDSLDPEIFKLMNGVGWPIDSVLQGIAAAKQAGLGPIKLNAVVRKGLNDQGIVDLARYAREEGHVLRLIEYMDVGETHGWRMEEVLPAAAVVQLIAEEWPLEAVAPGYPGEVANRYRYLDGGGELGVIASVSRPFCGGCTRLRLTAEGQLHTCLFSTGGHDLRSVLRGGGNGRALTEAIRAIWAARDDRYSELRSQQGAASGRKVEMSYLGG